MIPNPKLNFSFVLHAHQPAANPDSVIREIIQKAYLPVLKTFAQYSWFRFSLHISGSLLERLEVLSPEIIKMVKQMHAAGRLELLGGAYHEALLPFIPSIDRKEQILALRRKLKRLFAAEPKGAWIAERMWEPSLAADLASAGVGYTLVDEHGFLNSGFSDAELTGPFLTEDQGRSMLLFPIAKTLRYLFPFGDREQLRKVLHERAVKHPRSLWVFADDLEKFGAWPGTYESVHERGWLHDFLDMVSGNADWLNVITLGEARDEVGAKGLAYLPATSYPEMMRWSLPPALRNDTARSGNPRHFLIRYPEVNLLHKRMLMASEAVHSGPKPAPNHLELLWLSQTACSYWHGWFGGAYLPLLRLHSRACAVKAETGAMKKNRRNLLSTEEIDIDLCGKPEIAISTPDQWLLFKTTGGGLIAWEDRNSGFDRLGTMAAHPEEGKNAQTGSGPIFPFEDVFLPTGVSVEQLLIDPDHFCEQSRKVSYDVRVSPTEECIENEMTTVFPLQFPEGFSPVQVRKVFRVPVSGSGLELQVHLRNSSERKIESAYAIRVPFSVHVANPTEPIRLFFPEIGLCEIEGDTSGEVCGIQEIKLKYPSGDQTLVYCDHPLTVWYHPLFTRIFVEGQPTEILQATVLFFVLRFRFNPGETISLNLRFIDQAEDKNG